MEVARPPRGRKNGFFPTKGVEKTEYACMLSHFSRVQLFVTLQTVACRAPLSMGFSRQEYWSGSPCPPPGDLPDPGMNPRLLCLLHLQAGVLSHLGSLWEKQISTCKKINLDPNLTLNVRPETVKLLEESTGEKLHDVGFGSDFLVWHQGPRSKVRQMKLSQL